MCQRHPVTVITGPFDQTRTAGDHNITRDVEIAAPARTKPGSPRRVTGFRTSHCTYPGADDPRWFPTGQTDLRESGGENPAPPVTDLNYGKQK